MNGVTRLGRFPPRYRASLELFAGIPAWMLQFLLGGVFVLLLWGMRDVKGAVTWSAVSLVYLAVNYHHDFVPWNAWIVRSASSHAEPNPQIERDLITEINSPGRKRRMRLWTASAAVTPWPFLLSSALFGLKPLGHLADVATPLWMLAVCGWFDGFRASRLGRISVADEVLWEGAPVA